MHLYLYFDGGCKPNPGNGTCAAILVTPDGETVRHIGLALGHTTNNKAEHEGLYRGLEAAIELGATRVDVHGDSELILRQVFPQNGRTWAAGEELAWLVERTRKLVEQIPTVTATHIPRKQNSAADEICRRVRAETYEQDGAAATGETLEIAFVVSLKVTRNAADDQKKRNAMRKDLQQAIEKQFPIAGVTVKRVSA